MSEPKVLHAWFSLKSAESRAQSRTYESIEAGQVRVPISTTYQRENGEEVCCTEVSDRPPDQYRPLWDDVEYLGEVIEFVRSVK